MANKYFEKQDYYNTFDFVGDIALPKDMEKFRRTMKSKSGWTRDILGFRLENGENNGQYISLEYGHRENEKPMLFVGGDKVDFDTRLDEDLVKNAPFYSKIVVDLETDFDKKQEYSNTFFNHLNAKKDGDTERADALLEEFMEQADNRYEFLHMYDVINLLEEKLPELEGKYKLRVSGNIEPNFYNERIFLERNVDFIELVPNDMKNRFRGNLHLYYDGYAVKEERLEDEGKIDIRSYIQGYCSVSKKTKLFPVPNVVIESPKIDNEELQKTIDTRVNFLKDDVFGAVDRKAKYMHIAPFEVSFFSGATTREVDISDLTPFQRKALESGATEERHLLEGNAFGANVDEIRIINFNFKAGQEFKDGAIECNVKTDEVMDYLALDGAKEKKLDDVIESTKEEKPKEEPKKEMTDDTDELIDDLLSGL